MPLPVARAFIGTRGRMLDVADAGMPGAAALSDFVFGLQRTKLAGALVSSGLADTLGVGKRAPVELSRAAIGPRRHDTNRQRGGRVTPDAP